MSSTWTKLGRILQPNPEVEWMATCTGSSFAEQISDSSQFNIYVAGRDDFNRSLIGRIRIDLNDPLTILETTAEPVLGLGELGAFDETGVSYPCLVKGDSQTYMYYVGWIPSVTTSFQNHLGLAVQQDDSSFSRYSRGPILERTNDDFLCVGSAYVLRECDDWRMWYTAFLEWGKQPNDPKHRYVIKYAESSDGVSWNRNNHICVGIQNSGEHSIGKPSVIKLGDEYHMWYSYRGSQYRIGYATSKDGIVWQRKDSEAGIGVSATGWDSSAIAYPHVFQFNDDLFMLYCGNDYGKTGLGLARSALKNLTSTSPLHG